MGEGKLWGQMALGLGTVGGVVAGETLSRWLWKRVGVGVGCEVGENVEVEAESRRVSG